MSETKKTAALPLPDGWEEDRDNGDEGLLAKRDRLACATLRFDHLFTDRVSGWVGNYLKRAGTASTPSIASTDLP